MERVFRIEVDGKLVKPPLPSIGAFQRTSLEKFRERWVTAVGAIEKHTVEQVVRGFNGPKEKSYRRAAESLRVRPYCRRDGDVQAFIKAEKLNLSSKPDPAPRLIQPRSQRFNLLLGRYLKLNEKRMLKAIDKVYGEVTILSGYDSFSVGRKIHSKWQRFKDPIAIGVDAKRFDQHTSVPALEYEHSFYKACFPGDDELAGLLSAQLRNTGRGIARDGAIEYKTEGCRMSGDVNTSLGNKIIMCAMFYGYLTELGIFDEVSLINNGDDCVLIVERPLVQLVQDTMYDWFYQMGYRLEVEPPVAELEQIVFCQSQPVRIQGEYRMVRQLNSISKDASTLMSIQSQSDMELWLAAVGQCGIALNQGVPILSAFHNAMIRNSNSRKISKEYMRRTVEYGNMERLGGLKVRDLEITPDSRLSFFAAFGVLPGVQLAIEQYFNLLTLSYGSSTVMSLPAHCSVLHNSLFN